MTDETLLASYPFDVTYDGHQWLGTRAECFALIAVRDHLPWPMRMSIRPFKSGAVTLIPDHPSFTRADGTIWIPSIQRFRISPSYGLRCTGELLAEKPLEPFGSEALKRMFDDAERRSADVLARMRRGEMPSSGTVQNIEGD